MAKASSKEFKGILKRARELINNKDYVNACDQCQAALELESDNYTAHVFHGLCLSELEKNENAIDAYQRAIAINPNLTLAWKGLADFYDKNECPGYKTELVNCYQHLIDIYRSDGDRDRDIEMLFKLGDTFNLLNRFEDALKTYLDIGECNVEVKWKVINLLDKQISIKPEYANLQYTFYCELFSPENVSTILQRDSVEKHFGNFLNLILRQRYGTVSSEFVSDCCTCFTNAFPDNPLGLKTQVIIGVRQLLSNSDVLINDDIVLDTELMCAINKYQSFTNNKECDVLTLVHGLGKLCSGDWIAASQILETSNLFECQTFLVKSDLLIHRYKKVCGIANSLLRTLEHNVTVNTDRVADSLNYCCVLSLSSTSTDKGYDTALKLINTVKDSSFIPRHLIIKALATIYINKDCFEKSHKLVSKLSGFDKLYLTGVTKFKQRNFPSALDVFTDCLAVKETASVHKHLGMSHWHLGGSQRKQSLINLLKSAKLDRLDSQTFLYLGYYYRDVASDNPKATKCFSKAFELDISNSAAGIAFTDIVRECSSNAELISLYLKVTSEVEGAEASWAWLRLGLLHLSDSRTEDSIKALQCALRSSIEDAHIWECLGEAYLHRGSYNAALKAYNRALEINPELMYSEYRLAYINYLQHSYQDAIIHYESIVRRYNNYMPALKGLGECYIALGRYSIKQFLHKKAAMYMSIGIGFLWKAVRLKPNMSCLWKLLGDCCYISSLIPISCLDNVTLPMGDLCAETNENIKLRLSNLTIRCYTLSLHGFSECASLWHDLALAYKYKAGFTDDVQAMDYAIVCLKRSLLLDSLDYRLWNTFGGVLLISDQPKQAQHCFIRSLQLQPNNSQSWANLGVLYLLQKDIELAHEALKRAQSQDPSFITGWVGQAIIAEFIEHEDAMDLFRHTTDLGNNSESLIGYGNLVCRMLANRDTVCVPTFSYAIDSMCAASQAICCLSKYVDRFPDDKDGWIIYGRLLETDKLYVQSAMAYQTAYNLVEDKDSYEAQHSLMDLAVVWCRLKRYDSANELFGKVKLLSDCVEHYFATIAAVCSGNFQDAVALSKDALKLCKTERDRAISLAAFGLVLHRCGKPTECQRVLFESSKIQPSLPQSLLALCAIGLLQNDFNLSSAVLREAKDSTAVDKQVLAYLSSLWYALQGAVKDGRKKLAAHLHLYPNCSKSWLVMCKFLSQWAPQEAPIAYRAAETASCLSPLADNDKASLYLAISSLLMGSPRVGRKVQHLLHQRPYDNKLWALLPCSSYSSSIISSSLNNFKSLKFDFSFNLKVLKYVVEKVPDLKSSMSYYMTHIILAAGEPSLRSDLIDSCKDVVTNNLVKLSSFSIKSTSLRVELGPVVKNVITIKDSREKLMAFLRLARAFGFVNEFDSSLQWYRQAMQLPGAPVAFILGSIVSLSIAASSKNNDWTATLKENTDKLSSSSDSMFSSFVSAFTDPGLPTHKQLLYNYLDSDMQFGSFARYLIQCRLLSILGSGGHSEAISCILDDAKVNNELAVVGFYSNLFLDEK